MNLLASTIYDHSLPFVNAGWMGAMDYVFGQQDSLRHCGFSPIYHMSSSEDLYPLHHCPCHLWWAGELGVDAPLPAAALRQAGPVSLLGGTVGRSR